MGHIRQLFAMAEQPCNRMCLFYMDILINKKARIILKEGTGAMMEYGQAFFGYIKDLTQVYHKDIKDMYERYHSSILLVEDAFGEKSLIPCEDIDNIQYV